ncbi:Mobile element protein [Candidatus Enterovibrio altilux]|uniref:Mobile element protein n=1 Tax=Candidatus Enterovibrio altilux TaxID=1927128 RepID=A0A291B8V3_9GAMM|nr:Mobile element protein [Candidatus Enterovibrio luxaltus]
MLQKNHWKRHNQIKQNNYGRVRLFSGLAITTALMITCAFSMLLRGLQEFINSVFTFIQLHSHALAIHALANKLK